MKRLLHLAATSQGLRQSALMVVGNTMATGLSAVSLILISRLLGPTLFGEFSVGFALIMIVARINDAGITNALLKYASRAEGIDAQNQYFSVTWRLKLLLSAIILVVSAVIAQPLSQALNFPSPWLIFVALTFGNFASVYFEQLTGMLQALHHFGASVLGNFIQATFKLVMALVLVWLQFKEVFPIFTLYGIAPAVPLLFARWLLPSTVRLDLRKKYPQAQAEIIEMSKHTGTASIASTAVNQINILFVQGFLSPYETGLLGGVSKIQLLFSLATLSLSNVLFPRVARYSLKSDLQSYFKKAVLLAVLIGVGFLGVIALAPILITLTVGHEYLPGVPVLQLLLAAVAVMMATVPFTALFYTLSNPRYFSLTGILQLVLVIIGNVILVPRSGLIGSAWAELITRVCILLITIGWGWLLFKKEYRD